MLNNKFQMIKELDREYEKMEHVEGIVTWDEVSLIRKMLGLDNMDIPQLQYIKNFVIAFLSHRISDEKSTIDKINAYTTVIDDRICALGGEV